MPCQRDEFGNQRCWEGGPSYPNYGSPRTETAWNFAPSAMIGKLQSDPPVSGFILLAVVAAIYFILRAYNENNRARSRRSSADDYRSRETPSHYRDWDSYDGDRQ